MLYAACLDPGGYFRVDPITGRLYNQRPLLLIDPNWSAGHRTITVQVCDRLVTGCIGNNGPDNTWFPPFRCRSAVAVSPFPLRIP